MEKGQRVVFVRDVDGAGVGKHGTVIKVADDAVLVGCKLNGHLAPVLAQMWDVLPERLWERISQRTSATDNIWHSKPAHDDPARRWL
jgi:hypothetical protein